MSKIITTLRGASGAFAIVATALSVAPVTSVHGKEIFAVSLEDNDGHIASIYAGGKSFKDLLRDVISNRGMFKDFKHTNHFSGSLTYHGVADAIRIRADNAAYTVEIPSIGFVRTFDGGTRDHTYNEIKRWLRAEGLETYSKFLKEMARHSMISLSDGNPNAITARAATTVFHNFGFTPLEDIFAFNLDSSADALGRSDKAEKSDSAKIHFGNATYSGMGFQVSAGTFKAGDFNGKYADFDIPWKAHLGNANNRVDLALNLNANYMDVEGAQVGGFGFAFGAPVHIFRPAPGDRVKWVLTPIAGAQMRASLDMLDACALWMAGGINSLDVRVTNWFALSLINQATMHKGVAVAYKDRHAAKSYKFGYSASQTLLKNGLRASFRLADSALADLWVAETNFLKTAKVKNYTSAGVNFRWLALEHWRLQVGISADIGSGYQATSAAFQSVWNF